MVFDHFFVILVVGIVQASKHGHEIPSLSGYIHKVTYITSLWALVECVSRCIYICMSLDGWNKRKCPYFNPRVYKGIGVNSQSLTKG